MYSLSHRLLACASAPPRQLDTQTITSSTQLRTRSHSSSSVSQAVLGNAAMIGRSSATSSRSGRWLTWLLRRKLDRGTSRVIVGHGRSMWSSGLKNLFFSRNASATSSSGQVRSASQSFHHTYCSSSISIMAQKTRNASET
jgi:hypothetical protein